MALVALASSPALAVDATWLGGTGVWNTGANWTGGAVPDGIATFTNATPTAVTFTAGPTISSIQFSASASAYTFTFTGPGALVFNGPGVVNNSSSTQTFNLNGNVSVAGATNLGNASSIVYNISGGGIEFGGTSTGGLAQFNMTGGTMDMTGSSGPLGNNKYSLGSIAGTGGTIAVGTDELTVGGNGFATTFGGSITGAGGKLVKAGGGTLILTGTSTISTGVVVNQGTLQVGDGTSGIIPIAGGSVAAGATLAINRPTQFGFSTFSGAGNVTVMGAGVLASGALTYTGTTTVLSGATLTAFFTNNLAADSRHVINSGAILTLDSGGFSNQQIASLGGAGSVIIGNATLTLGSDNTSDADFSGVISGTGGTLVKTGTGTQTLSGANTYNGGTTVNGGTLQIGNGGTTGQILTNVTVAAGANIAYNFSNNVTYSGVVSGAGNGIKNGTGSLTLTGVNTYSGTTTINAGTLIVNGSIANSTVNVVGGILKGTGTVGGITGRSGGTVAPGNSIGTINTVTTSFVPGSIYEVEVNAAGASDLINATGTATLTGGRVSVVTTAGVSLTSTYTILTAAGGVTGTFTDVVVDNPTYRGLLTYNANNVFLSLQPNAIPVGLTPNQIAARGGIQNGGFAGNPLFAALVGQPAATAQAAYDLASGEIHATLLSSLLEEGQSLRRTLLERANQLPGQETGVNFWAHVNTNWGDTDSDGNAAEASRDYYQITVGVDKDVSSDWRIGLAAGYAQENLDVTARRSSAKFNRGHVAAYFAGKYEMVNLRGGIAQMFGNVKTNRAIVFTTINDATASKQSVDATEVFGEVGYPTAIGNFPVEPFAGLTWIRASAAATNETGGSAALKVLKGDATGIYSTLGAQTSMNVDTKSFPLTFGLRAAWQHNFEDAAVSRNLAFANTGQGFTVLGAAVDADRALLDASVSAQVLPQLFLSLGYQGALGSHSNDNAVRLDGSWRF